MDWWQTLIVAVAPVLLTLAITNLAESRRRKQDADEREKDRRAAEEARADERRSAVEDHWRNERLERMTALVDLVSEMTSLANETTFNLDFANDSADFDDLNKQLIKAARKSFATLSRHRNQDLPQAVTAASIIASDDYYTLTSIIVKDMRELSKPVSRSLMNIFDRPADPDELATMRTACRDFSRHMSLFNSRLVAATRAELTGDAKALDELLRRTMSPSQVRLDAERRAQA